MGSSEENRPRGKHAAHAKPARSEQVPQQEKNPYEGVRRAPTANPSSQNVRESVYEPIDSSQPTQVLPAAATRQSARTRTRTRQNSLQRSRSGNTQQLQTGQQRATRTQGNSGNDNPTGTVRPFNMDAAKPKKRHRALKVILGILAVLVIAVVGFGIWFTHTLDDALSRGNHETIAGNVLEPTTAGEAFYVLVLGSDSREGSGTSDAESESGDNERSDVMMLLRIDPTRHLITMVSIPRDTPYVLDNGDLVKINEAYNVGGAAKSVEAVNQLTGVRISHYAAIHFSELEQIVDSLGGVTVNVPIELSYEDALTGRTITLEPGEHTLNGQQAQIFARARQEYEIAQDANRQNSVRVLAIAIIKKALDRPVTEIPGTIIDLAQHVGTDMRAGDLVSLATSFGLSLKDMTVYTGSGPTDGDINPAAGDKWLCYYNPTGWKKLMEVVDAGGNPEGMTFDDTSIPW